MTEVPERNWLGEPRPTELDQVDTRPIYLGSPEKIAAAGLLSP